MNRETLMRRLATLVSGALLGNLVILAATPLLSRLYTPDAFGDFAAFVSFAGILGAVLCLRYEQAVYIPKSLEDSLSLVVGGFSVAVMLSVLVMFALFLLRPFIEIGTLGLLIFLVPLASLTLALFNLFSNWAVREHQTRVVFKTRLSRALVQAGGQSSLGFFVSSGPGLIIGDLMGRFAGLALLFRLFLRPLSQKGLPRVGEVKKVLLEYRRFPMVAAPGALINVGVMQSPPLLLAALYSPAAAGFYFMAQRLIAAPMAIVGQSAGQVYSSDFMRKYDTDPAGARRLFRKGVALLFVIGGLPLLVLGLVAEEFMPWLLGEGWTQSGLFIFVLLPFFVGQFVMSPFANLLNLMGRQSWLFWWDFSRFLTAIPAFVIPAKMGLDASYALFLFGMTMGGMYGVLLLLIEMAARSAVIFQNENAH